MALFGKKKKKRQPVRFKGGLFTVHFIRDAADPGNVLHLLFLFEIETKTRKFNISVILNLFFFSSQFSKHADEPRKLPELFVTILKTKRSQK